MVPPAAVHGDFHQANLHCYGQRHHHLLRPVGATRRPRKVQDEIPLQPQAEHCGNDGGAAVHQRDGGAAVRRAPHGVAAGVGRHLQAHPPDRAHPSQKRNCLPQQVQEKQKKEDPPLHWRGGGHGPQSLGVRN